MLRQTAGLEVHEQGQGPGFASDASVRGFSSDHSTDLALWIDGVPINEPVNGHAEGYNDFSLLFPGGIRDIDVLRGPTSALFGNFAVAGIVNVRTLERMRGSQGQHVPGTIHTKPKYDRGDRVKVKDGTFAGMEGEVKELLEAKGLVRVELTIFGRPVPVELEYWQVEHI